jgi:tRNA (adenine37-N6)-methyltransferase
MDEIHSQTQAQEDTLSYTIQPVAFVKGLRSSPEDDHWGGEVARIELVEGFDPEALVGLDSFSHVEVLFLFHQVAEDKVVSGARHPRNNGAWPRVGIFAQRGKSRPNRIGSTICRVVGLEGRALVVSELDAIDGTPVIDLKPVMHAFLPRQPTTQPQWATELMAQYWSHKPSS